MVCDYVFGMEVVFGCGEIFNFGGKVVKNVIGYDFFCVLCGFFGMLVVVIIVILKVNLKLEIFVMF